MITLLLALSAFAQEEIEVVGEHADPTETSSSVTVIEVDDSLSASVDVADAITLAPGTVVHRLGGLGAWSSVSIRGSTSRQVEVFLDGVPLNPEGSGTFDLSELPLRAFERIEVYRGSAPPQLGSTSIGGAVNLVTGDAKATGASLAAGSLGTIRGSGAASGAHFALFADAFTTDGDFRWFDDRGTAFSSDDDRFRRRVNNDKRQGNVVGRLDAGDEKLSFSLLNAFVVRGGGVAGFTSAPTRHVRYGFTRDLLVGTVEGSAGAVRLTGRGYGMLRVEELDDRRGEIVGGGQTQSQDWSRSVGARGSADWGASSLVRLFFSGEVRSDRFSHGDVLADVEDAAQSRTVEKGTGAATFSLAKERIFVAPATRIYLAQSVDPTQDAVDPELELSPQVGIRGLVGESLVLKGSVGRYVRPPDLLELYGNRGAMRGNPELRSETGLNADISVQTMFDGMAGSARLELGGFWTESADRIVLRQNSQGIALPLNLDNARIRGLEFAAVLGWMQRLESSTNFTRLVTQNLDSNPTYSGNQLARAPGWELHQRTGLVWRSARIGHRYDFSDANYWDLTNFFRTPPRHIHGLFVRAISGPWSVEADVLNLTDRIVETVPVEPLLPESGTVEQSVTDFAGYPLPGRTFLLTMRWQP